MSFFRTLCQDTFDRCFAFVKDPQDNHDYKKVELTGNNHEEEDRPEKSYFSDYSTQNSSSYQTPNINEDRSTEMPAPVAKKNVLIGNYDEDMLVKKREEVKNADNETYDDLFGDIPKPTFDQKLSSIKSAPKQNSSTAMKNQAPEKTAEKFKMDDELKVEEGWGDEDYEIKL